MNDYERLLLALAPLALLVAYHSDYRSALIAAVLIMGAPLSVGITSSAVIHVAVGRGLVVGLGALVGIAVSVLVLPAPQKQAVASKALCALADMIVQLDAAGMPPSQKTEKAEARLRKGHAEHDPSGQIDRLIRHAPAVCILLRSQWRKEPGEGRAAFCAALLAVVDHLRDRSDTSVNDVRLGLWHSIPDVSGVENWMQRALAGDVARIAQLMI